VTNVGDEMRARMLESLQVSQEAVVDAVRRWAETVQQMRPEMPNMPQMPQADLPNPSELVDKAFGFASDLLDAQRKFTQELLSAAAPAYEPKQRPSSSS
jgi:hypothetical protein